MAAKNVRQELRTRIEEALSETSISENVRQLLAEIDGYLKAAVSVEEAGHRGGMTVKASHGTEYFREIGKRGGERTAAQYGRAFFQKIGRVGGKNAAKPEPEEE